MPHYMIDANPAVLTTEHDGDGTWNGFSVPRATYAELAKYRADSLAHGIEWAVLPHWDEPSGDLSLIFPCGDSCEGSPLPDGSPGHFHEDDTWTWRKREDISTPVDLDGLTFERVEYVPATMLREGDVIRGESTGGGDPDVYAEVERVTLAGGNVAVTNWDMLNRCQGVPIEYAPGASVMITARGGN